MLDGFVMTDEEHEERSRASTRTQQPHGQEAKEALEALGFSTDGLGAEMELPSGKKKKPPPEKPMRTPARKELARAEERSAGSEAIDPGPRRDLTGADD